ncbi:SpoIIE family protein phosphatase [Actinomadura rugatobispora]|uniref:SpoIIE family protein phosphatase n=1 Tax=Actinomadura rugatobispora TaxID=1994 RepID=A0ABW0ZTC2_9ACTN|nr:SpoIIE family protein phosphatase [Actinomadura rugatobispora]
MDETFTSHSAAEVPSTAAGMVDARGVLIWWTKEAARLLGYRPDEAVGRRAVGLLSDGLPAWARGCVERDEEGAGRLLLRHRDGHRVELAVRVVPVHGPGADVHWLVTLVRAAGPGPGAGDGAPTLGELALTQSPMGVMFFDRAGRVRGASRGGLRAAGARLEEIVGLTVDRLSADPAYKDFKERLERVLRTGREERMNAYVRTPGENRAHAWSSIVYALQDPEGRVLGAAVAALDVTEEDRAKQRLAIVNAASARIGTVLDAAATAQQLADIAAEQFADFVCVDLLDGVLTGEEAEPRRLAGRVVLHRAAQRSLLAGCPEAMVETGGAGRYPEDSPPARALVTGRSLLRRTDDSDVRAWLARDPAWASSVREFGIHSFIVVPLPARGTIIGLAQFYRHRTPDPFDTEDLLLAEEITARAALSIDNARRYAEQRETALAMQRSLLPGRSPPHPAVTVASRYLPTGSRAGVGGDWFDVIPLSGGRVALVVGDVVGHGLQASATMGRLRTAVRTLAEVDMPPDELLTHLDDVVLSLDREEGPGGADGDGRQTGDIGATCLYAVYDPVSRVCAMARAGHPVPALVAPGGTVDFPALPAGPPLGLGGLPFESAELELPDGTLIALFTDGLIESTGHDVDVALDRLSDVLRTPAPSLERLCDEALAELLPGAPADDVALLLARTQGLDASHVATWDLPADPAMVSRAREWATARLAAWGLEHAAIVTELLVSELVTNALRYGKPPVRLRLIRLRLHGETSLITEVSDASSTSPHLRRARAFDEHGRGLFLVAQLTHRWGSRQSPSGKTIWAEQTLPE